MTPQSNIQQQEMTAFSQVVGSLLVLAQELSYAHQCAMTPIWY